MSTIGVVAAAAGGIATIRTGLIEPLLAQGHRVTITLTPTAGAWLSHSGEADRLADLTGYPVRSSPRLPSEPKPHPPGDLYIAAPFTFNSTTKLALGICDNQALTVLTEALGTKPMIILPLINAAQARHPAWNDHLQRLTGIGAQLIYGPELWSLADASQPVPRGIPWRSILASVPAA